MNRLQEKILSADKILVDFYADWCGPCRMLSPIVDELSEVVNVLKVNVDDNPELTKQYGVMSIPCLILFKDGIEIKKNVGLMSKSELLKFLED